MLSITFGKLVGNYNIFVIKKDELNKHTGLGLWYLTTFSTIFHDIVAVSFIGEGNRRKLLTCRK
jgi:hypothetical protein